MKPDYILFTDGSCIQDKHKRLTCSAYAFLVVNNHLGTSTKSTSCAGGVDSFHAELMAIAEGLKYIRTLVPAKSRSTILVISDCKTAVQYLRNPSVLKDRCKFDKSVRVRMRKNQEIYADLKSILKNKHMSMTYVHINSHLELREADMVVRKVNDVGFTISDRDAKSLIKFNRIVDKLAHKEAKAFAEMSGLRSDDGFIRLIHKEDKKYDN